MQHVGWNIERVSLKEDILKCTLDFVTSESRTWRMIKYLILLWWLCLVVIDASPVAAPDTREVLDLQSACARMDIWGSGEVAKALCGAVGTCTKSRGRLVCSCSRCSPGTGGGIGCALSGKKWNQIQSKRKQSLTFKRVSFQFILSFTPISSSRICRKSLTSQTSLSKKDDLSSWSPSRDKLRRIHRTNTLALSLLQ